MYVTGRLIDGASTLNFAESFDKFRRKVREESENPEKKMLASQSTLYLRRLPSMDEEVTEYDKMMKRKEKIEGLIPEFKNNFDVDKDDSVSRELIKNEIPEENSMAEDTEVVAELLKSIDDNKKVLRKNIKELIKFEYRKDMRNFVLKEFNDKVLPEFKKAHGSKSEMNLLNLKKEINSNPLFKNLAEVTTLAKSLNKKKKPQSNELIFQKKLKKAPDVKQSNTIMKSIAQINNRREKLMAKLFESQTSLIVE